MLAELPPKQHGFLLLLLAVFMLILGMALVLLLSWMWRRFNGRQAPRPARRDLMPDLWQAGADRLSARLDQQHPPAQEGPEAVPDDQLPLDPDEQWGPDDEAEDDGPPKPDGDDGDDGDDGGGKPRR